MKITVAQLNPIIGDIEGSTRKILDIFREFGNDSDLIVFPELFLVGYPPRDLLEKPKFIEKVQTALETICSATKGTNSAGILVGLPVPTGKKDGTGLYNAAVLIQKGKILGTAHKSLLPAYDVFDETRYFDSSEEVSVIPFNGLNLGISLCEDMWADTETRGGREYGWDPIEKIASKKADIIINLSASPYYAGKEKIRHTLISRHAEKHKIPFLFVNQIGGNDELVFDGRSAFFDKRGHPVLLFPPFKEHIEIVDTELKGDKSIFTHRESVEEIEEALILGIRDYMKKCMFKQAIVGISGGIDSAVTCALAVAAVGCENVRGIFMPSEYSSPESESFSNMLAKNLKIKLDIIPIGDLYAAYKNVMSGTIDNIDENNVEVFLQNIQARIRGNILMALSNKYGSLVLTTGNKSELAVGYCTLYGDMAGGLAAISDVPKTMVYSLAEHMNSNSEIIPEGIIKRPPSAELKPGQLDQETLPSYGILDEILYFYLEEQFSENELIERGFDPEIVRWVVNAVMKNEYKRRQAPLGLKVTTKAFGIGRRMPIAAKIDES